MNDIDVIKAMLARAGVTATDDGLDSAGKTVVQTSDANGFILFGFNPDGSLAYVRGDDPPPAG